MPDAQVVAFLAYVPAFVLGAPFGWPPVEFVEIMSWPVQNQLACVAGGALWAAAALAHSRRARGACAACGRDAVTPAWATPSAATRWGTASAYVAAGIPLFYAATRLAWAAGIPLGITESFLREGEALGMWTAGAALVAVAAGGAWLTIGLVRPWGEVFPRWIPLLHGRRVPPWAATVPASIMSAIFFAAGVDTVRAFVRDGFPAEGWGTIAPALLWPGWGAALGAATLAYHLRRRGPCAWCGRD